MLQLSYLCIKCVIMFVEISLIAAVLSDWKGQLCAKEMQSSEGKSAVQ